MTNGEKKSILCEYQAIERRILRLMEEKARWMAKATAVTPAYSDMPKGAGRDKIQNAVERIWAIEKRLDQEIDMQADLRGRIEVAVCRIQDGKLRDLMRYRYIDGLTWEQIAVTMNFSYQWVCKLHGDALEKIEFS